MHTRSAFLLLLFLNVAAFPQNPPANSLLFDQLAGKWTAQTSIGGQSGTHDIDAEWVIQHHYLRLHEVSREKDAKGNPQYEAMVFITIRPQKNQIACVWLDVFSGAGASSIGVADPKENDIPFIFRNEAGETVFTNEFNHHPRPTRGNGRWKTSTTANLPGLGPRSWYETKPRKSSDLGWFGGRAVWRQAP